MHPFLRYRAKFLAVLVLAGCAVAGTNFVRPDDNAYTLGKTTRAQLLASFSAARLGAEAETGETQSRASGKTLKYFTYGFATRAPSDHPGGIAARTQTFYFYDDVLVARQFTSSFVTDSSDWDETKVKDLVKGVTTRAEVVEMLGRPSGAYIWPAVSRTHGEAIGYHHTYITTPLTGLIHVRVRHSKHLIVTFDGADRVEDVEFRQGSRSE